MLAGVCKFIFNLLMLPVYVLAAIIFVCISGVCWGVAATMTFIESAASLIGPFLLRGALFIAHVLVALVIVLLGCSLLFSMPYALLGLFLLAALF